MTPCQALPAPQLDAGDDPLHFVHDDMFRAAVLRRRGDAAWAEHEARAFGRLQEMIIREAQLSPALPRAAIQEDVAAIGITNQRETTVVWERATGRPIANAIVWQDRRTAGICDALRNAGHTDLIRRKTGLVIDAYFSGTKLKWLLDNVPGARDRAMRGMPPRAACATRRRPRRSRPR